MKNQELLKRKAYLESVNDQLESELSYLNELLIKIGFSNGLASVKEVAEHLIEENLECHEG